MVLRSFTGASRRFMTIQQVSDDLNGFICYKSFQDVSGALPGASRHFKMFGDFQFF